MNENPRYALITSFLALPGSAIEQQWLTDAVRSAKESASTAMDGWEQYGASNFKNASEDDSFVQESEFFSDFENEKKIFERWLAIEEELYLSIGYEHFFNEKQSKKIESRLQLGGYHTRAESNLLRIISNNLMHHVSHKKDLLESAICDFNDAQKEAKDYGSEDTTDFDDEWFRIQKYLESREEHLKCLETVLPLCWDSLREFAMSFRLVKYIPVNLTKFIKENDCDSFIYANLMNIKTSEKFISNQEDGDRIGKDDSYKDSSNFNDGFFKKK